MFATIASTFSFGLLLKKIFSNRLERQVLKLRMKEPNLNRAFFFPHVNACISLTFRQVWRYLPSRLLGVTRILQEAILIVIHKVSKLQRVRCKFNDVAEKLVLFNVASPTYAS